ncbi:MAG TPA: hypothetical protein VNT99_08775 [Methylomirabilota bacterium]|nr:hypothetical protein [Methylomirabilota bacterium]
MKNLFPFLFAAACLCFSSGCQQEKKAAAPASDASSGNPLTAPVDYVGAIGKAQKSAQKTLSTVGLDQALRTFYTDEGRFPKDLNELVTKGTISQIPPAPHGMKYDYDSKAGTIKIVPE